MLIPKSLFNIIDKYNDKIVLGSLVQVKNLDGRTMAVHWKSSVYLFRKAKSST